MKKIIALLLAVVMIVAGNISVLADEGAADIVDSDRLIEDYSEDASFLAEDNDTLLQDYFDILAERSINDYFHASPKMFSNASSLQASAGDSLSGKERKLYDLLKEYIISVTNGEMSSTIFTVPADVAGYPEGVYSAEDLGVEAVVVNGAISEEAQAALNNLIDGPDIAAAVHALLADCPYEFFWFDKTAGYNMNASASIICQYDSEFGGYKMGYTNVNYRISFYVSAEYTPDGNTYSTNVDNGKILSIHKAAEKAANIVASNSGKTDYGKLLAYKNEICSLVSYNFSAAGNSGIPYGNPWQLIWVFDDDSETNVVCEGYAKAFQYLCSISSFNSTLVASRLVSGTMAGGTGADGHMWNVVTMDDDQNYIVDVTNCDEGTIGAPDKLFLAGAAGDINSAYEVVGVKYIYSADTKSLYSQEQLTLSQQNYDPENEVEPQDYVLGDVNRDGEVTADDLTVLARHIAKIDVLTDAELLRNADVNSDSSIDANDLTRLARFIARIIKTL